MVARGRAMNMQTSTRPREHKQCADNPDAAQLLPNFAERAIETYRSSSSLWTGPIRVSHWARVHHRARGEVWDKVRHRPGAIQLSNKPNIVVVKYCCQLSNKIRKTGCRLSNKLKIIVAKYCIQLSNKLEIMQLSARTTCATRCTTTSAKQSTTQYRCKTDHQNQIFAKKTILQEFYLGNLFCKNFILQTYFAGGKMRVQIWHKVWNPIRHRIRRGEKKHFFMASFFLTYSSS